MKIKVCGMKYPENMADVAALDPDYLGFIFWEPSPRSFAGSLPPLPAHIKKVGVFVDASIPAILEIAADLSLDLIQLHGKESPEYCAHLKTELGKFTVSGGVPHSPIGIIKAISIGGPFDFDSLKPYQASVDYFLFDSKGPLPGGNGFAFDWQLLKDYALDTPFFLSGGIGMGEMENLLKFQGTSLAEKCHAIDVNSAFEVQPGLKDARVLHTFIKKIKL